MPKKKTAPKWIRECIGVSAHPGTAGSVLVVSSDEERQSFNSEVFRFEVIDTPAKQVFQVDDLVTSMWISGSGKCFLAGALGRCWEDATGTARTSQITGQRLFRIWGLDENDVYAVGESGTCMHFDGTTWRPRNEGLAGYLYALAGTSPTSILCAGDGGLLARFDGTRWSRIALPTTAALRAVHALSPDELLVCGLDGACYRVRGTEVTALDAADHDLYSIATFKGETYMGSPSGGVFKVEGDRLVSFKPIAKGQDMSTSSDLLWTCGLEQTARFDGEGWKKVDFQ